jgi:hypothetical protein
MSLQRGQVRVGEVVLEAEPFEWPRGPWEVLELHMTEKTGWSSLTAENVAQLNSMYNGAHGAVIRTLAGLTVQYVEGTGPSELIEVEDWRGNRGLAAFVPDEGLTLSEIPGSGDVSDPLTGGFWTGTIRLVIIAEGE